MPTISFVVPVADRDVFHTCFLSSPLFREGLDLQVIPQAGFPTAGLAFNDGMDRAAADVVVIAHQDVVFPKIWARLFTTKLGQLESVVPRIGVVGCVGMTSNGGRAGHIYRHDRELLPEVLLPARVETLDELLICIRKSSGLRFDPALPSFFGYAVDLCLQARERGLENFAIDAPCFHQAKNRKEMSREFYISWNYLAEKWKALLPVQTLSGTLEGKRPSARERLRHFIFRMTRSSPPPWWQDLPQIDVEEILFADEAGVKSESSGSRRKVAP